MNMLFHQLSSGRQIPLLGLGTFDLRGEEGTEAVLAALDAGYRYLNTASGYDNEEAVPKWPSSASCKEIVWFRPT